MNIGFWLCAVLVIAFAALGIFFALLKDRAAKYLSGFNMLPKAEQELYDKARISRDMRNSCFIWTAVMAAGAVACWLLTTYAFIPAYIIWIVLFFRDFHIDARKAYKKYLLEKENTQN
ncbi:MAG: DUF3784 domain-containing protein [Lachnospiraceae bacterium]|nr:DUF3784 domain-containing protein [Lachnospiraceae bacterium]